MLAILAAPGRPSAAAGVVAENQTSAEHPVAAVQATLDSHHQYTIRIDGPAGAPFSAVSAQTYVDARATQQGSDDRTGSFDGKAPYTVALVAPGADLRYWHYAVVVTPGGTDDLTVSILDGSSD